MSKFFTFGFLGMDRELGMCESVRTRNTLHIVGAPKSEIWDNAVEGRKEKERKKENTEKREKRKYAVFNKMIKYDKYDFMKYYKILKI